MTVSGENVTEFSETSPRSITRSGFARLVAIAVSTSAQSSRCSTRVRSTPLGLRTVRSDRQRTPAGAVGIVHKLAPAASRVPPTLSGSRDIHNTGSAELNAPPTSFVRGSISRSVKAISSPSRPAPVFCHTSVDARSGTVTASGNAGDASGRDEKYHRGSASGTTSPPSPSNDSRKARFSEFGSGRLIASSPWTAIRDGVVVVMKRWRPLVSALVASHAKRPLMPAISDDDASLPSVGRLNTDDWRWLIAVNVSSPLVIGNSVLSAKMFVGFSANSGFSSYRIDTRRGR
jgi:hypothetical protein